MDKLYSQISISVTTDCSGILINILELIICVSCTNVTNTHLLKVLFSYSHTVILLLYGYSVLIMYLTLVHMIKTINGTISKF